MIVTSKMNLRMVELSKVLLSVTMVVPEVSAEGKYSNPNPKIRAGLANHCNAHSHLEADCESMHKKSIDTHSIVNNMCTSEYKIQSKYQNPSRRAVTIL